MKYLIIVLSLITTLGCSPKFPKEYILQDKAFVPEGIDYSKKKDAIYLTSVTKSKIIQIDRKSRVQKDFIKEKEFGYSPGAGLYVDDERNQLHAIGGYYRFADSLSSLFTFNLHSGELVKKYDIKDEGEHFLNDMVKDKKGNIYLTNTKDSSIYFLGIERGTLELFYQSTEIQYPNGIAISEDNSKLYIASFSKGVRVLDISTKKLLNNIDTMGISQGIDGLEFHKNHLYAVQNGVRKNTQNFRKLILNEAQDKIIDVEIIDSHTPKLNAPLTFCIVDKQAIVIANSNIQYLDQLNFRFSKADSIPFTKLLVYSIEELQRLKE